jgi:uncharacterized protein YprB with RNaseH-like and TPR domain
LIKAPSIVLLDIETSPLKGYAWQTWDTSILKVIEPSKIISVAWKELGDAKVQVKALCDYKKYKKGIIDDEELIKEVWNVLDRADIVIAHNGNSFDIKRLNSRFIYYGLAAPSAYKAIDTLTVAKKYFKFDSNALNNLGVYLGLGQKVENGGFGLWIRCLEQGDPEAWKLMKEYNAQDVTLLEKVYLTLRPYITNHPNTNALVDKPGMNCPTCQSEKVTKRGFSITRTGRRQRFQCNDCGSWSMGSLEKIKNPILISEDY